MGQLRLTASASEHSLAWLRALDRDLAPPGQPVGRTLVWTALGVETGLFLWLAIGLTVQWAVALPGALLVAGTLAIELARARRGPGRERPWLVTASLAVSMVLSAVLGAFVALLLLLVLFQGALAGKGILPFLIVPAILGLATYMQTRLPLFLVLMLVLLLDLGVLMDAGPIVLLALPLVASVGVVVVLFQAVSSSSHTAAVNRVMVRAGRARDS